MGVVNNRIDIDALEKSSGGGGGGGGGGLTVDVLWSGNVTSSYKDITEDLAHPITDYKFLLVNFISGVNVNPGQLLYVPGMSTGTNNSNYLFFGANNINIRLGDGTVSIGGQNYNGISLLGIK